MLGAGWLVSFLCRGILSLGGGLPSLAFLAWQNPRCHLGRLQLGWPYSAKKPMGCPVIFEFQISSLIFSSISMPHAMSPKELFAVRVKLRFNWVSYVLSGSPIPCSRVEGAVSQE